VREVIEETGLIPYKVEYLGESYTSSGFTNEHIHHFYVEVNSKNKREQELDHDEQITLVHIPFNDVLRYINDSKLVGSHAHACLLKYLLKNFDFNLNDIKG
jgi:8-oxo-dGTP pyrophosphatase MutT (NUDIX family)